MTPMVLILALLLEPAEPITDEPWDHVTPFEFIEEMPLDEIERKLRHEELRERYRILENRDANR